MTSFRLESGSILNAQIILGRIFEQLLWQDLICHLQKRTLCLYGDSFHKKAIRPGGVNIGVARQYMVWLVSGPSIPGTRFLQLQQVTLGLCIQVAERRLHPSQGMIVPRYSLFRLLSLSRLLKERLEVVWFDCCSSSEGQLTWWAFRTNELFIAVADIAVGA